MATTFIPGDADVMVVNRDGASTRWFKTVEEAIAYAEWTCLECRVYADLDDEDPILDQWV